MASVKQIEANRINAQLSTGPRTEAGKEASKANALKHGFRAQAFEVLPNEDPEVFAARLDSWNRDLAPTNEVETHLVRHAAVTTWKLDRADRFEKASLTRRVLDAINACDCEDDDVPALREAAAIASFDPSIEGERLRRYQFSLNRELRQTVEALLKLRKSNEAKSANEAKSVAPNEANSANEPKSVAPNEANSTNEAKSVAPNEPKSRHKFPVSGRVGPQPWVAPRFDSLPVDMDLLSGSTATAAWVDLALGKG